MKKYEKVRKSTEIITKMSFGKEFGKLIHRRRGVEGLSQRDLALQAFGDEDARVRISELENGKIDKPHAKTVDLIAVALNISNDELDKLYHQNGSPNLIGNLLDFFYTEPGKEAVKIEVAIDKKADKSGNYLAFLFHTGKLRDVSIVRMEYFAPERDFVVLDSRRWRRSIGLPLSPGFNDYMHKVDEVQLVYAPKGSDQLKKDKNIKNNKFEGKKYPLKFIE